MTVLDLIKKIVGSFEGCKLTAYKDVKGIWTIGWGYAGADVFEGEVWSQQEADDHLAAFLKHVIENVVHNVKTPFTDNQLAAFCSLAYNIGLGAFDHSTLLFKFNSGDSVAAADEFLRWNKGNGKVIDGLTNRRRMERELFLNVA